ncbi:MAG: hypothetical protein WKG07_23790 [Hymenobacter sp.]
MPKSELAESIKWQAKQYVPSPLDEVILDWHVVGEVKNKRRSTQPAPGGDGATATAAKNEIEVMLIAAPISLVEKYVAIIHDAGFKPLALEIEPLSLARLGGRRQGRTGDCGSTSARPALRLRSSKTA